MLLVGGLGDCGSLLPGACFRSDFTVNFLETFPPNEAKGVEKTACGANLCSGRRGRYRKLREPRRRASNRQADRKDPRNRFCRRRSGLRERQSSGLQKLLRPNLGAVQKTHEARARESRIRGPDCFG